MSSFLRKFKREKEPNYKELYEIELNNRKKYEKRYRQKCAESIELQKQTGIADLRKKLMQVSDELEQKKLELSEIKEDRSKLYVKLEDTRNELEIERNKNKNGK